MHEYHHNYKKMEKSIQDDVQILKKMISDKQNENPYRFKINPEDMTIEELIRISENYRYRSTPEYAVIVEKSVFNIRILLLERMYSHFPTLKSLCDKRSFLTLYRNTVTYLKKVKEPYRKDFKEEQRKQMYAMETAPTIEEANTILFNWRATYPMIYMFDLLETMINKLHTFLVCHPQSRSRMEMDWEKYPILLQENSLASAWKKILPVFEEVEEGAMWIYSIDYHTN